MTAPIYDDVVYDLVSVPNGTYLCAVAEVRPRTGENGAQRWMIRWVVADGPYVGRTAAWDSISFHPREVRRATLILARLGFPIDSRGEWYVGLEGPSTLVGRRAYVTVYANERIDPTTGQRVISNRVPYAGVEAEPRP